MSYGLRVARLGADWIKSTLATYGLSCPTPTPQMGGSSSSSRLRA